MSADLSIQDFASKCVLPHELRIGVTGDRQISDPEAVTAAVNRVLDHIQHSLEAADEYPEGAAGSPRTAWQKFESRVARLVGQVWRSLPLAAQHTPHDRRTPIVWSVVSPLAKGADRIVAKAVLERPWARLKVITPFPVDEYRRDFVEPEDLAEFDQLYALDPQPIQLHPQLGAPGNPHWQARRNDGYMAMGQRVVDSSEVLIAIWNGKPAAGRGGTGDIVRHAIETGQLVFWINSLEPDRPACQLVRFEQPDGDSPAYPVTSPLPTIAETISPRFHRLAAYNRDQAHNAAAMQAIFRNKASELESHYGQAGLPQTTWQSVCKNLLPHFAYADQLAVRYQTLYLRSAIMLYALAAFAVTVVVAQVLFLPHSLWLISFEIAAMLLAVLLLRLAKVEGWHEKWLNYRHVAERLGAALFTVLLRCSTNLNPPSSVNVLPFYHSPENWFIEPIRLVMDRAKSADGFDCNASLDSLKRLLVNGWIRNQAKWHALNAQRKSFAAKQFHHIGLILFLSTLLMAIFHLLGIGHAHEGEPSISPAWHFVGLGITFLAIVFPAWAAAVHAVGTLLDWDRISARSERMSTVLNELASQIEHASDLEQLNAEISVVEQIIVAENQEWLASLSFHELQLPV